MCVFPRLVFVPDKAFMALRIASAKFASVGIACYRVCDSKFSQLAKKQFVRRCLTINGLQFTNHSDAGGGVMLATYHPPHKLRLGR